MIRLPKIFSDRALYLHSAPLTVRGEAAPDSCVTVTLLRNNDVVLKAEGKTDGDGRFFVNVNTPEASFDTYEMTVECGEDRVSFGDILFGELWLATGQSNMQMENRTQDECDEMLDSLVGTHVRAFYSPRCVDDYEYPFSPLDFYEGKWVDLGKSEQRRDAEECSAVATAWAKHLYKLLLSQGREVPVGFADLSRGGASTQSFVTEDGYLRNKKIYKYFATTDKLPTPENWNTRGKANYQQSCSEYNLLVAPTRGVKYRGMLWYQGECNVINEYMRRIYGEMLYEIRRSYADTFGVEGQTFPFVASHIFPWIYAPDSGECRVSYLNKAITDLSRKYPLEHMHVPVCDLKPTFEFSNMNDPIHPTHKYVLGARMATLCENALFGRRVKKTQKCAPYADKFEVRDGKIYVTFKHVGTGLYVKGRKVRGLYIRSAEGVYTPAFSEITDERTLCVYHPFIENPAHVAYASSDYEYDANLYAGEFAVSPFASDMQKGAPLLNIEIKSFTDMELDGEVIYEQYGNERKYNISSRHPIFYGAEGTTCVYDSDYSRSGRSLRLIGESNKLCAYVLSRKFHQLDLENYREMRAWLLNVKDLAASLTLTYEDGQQYTTAATQLRAVRGGWGEYSYDLGSIPEGKITRMQFNFEIGEGNLLQRYVNIDCITLVPKK